MSKTILQAEITHVDRHHGIAVIVFEENHDAIMLPLEALPDPIVAGQSLTITVDAGE